MRASRALLAEHSRRGAGIRRLLRLLLVAFFVAVLLTEPPIEHGVLCWVIVGCYLVWALAVGAMMRAGLERAERLSWLALFIDVGVLAALTLITDSSASVSWTPYLLINGFFLIPVMAAAQLNPVICVVVITPSVFVYLGSGLLIRQTSQEPISYVLLRSAMLATVGLGAILLSRLQRSRVETIAGLLTDRTALLAEMVTLQQREQRDLAEALHDGALQYVLGARQELDDAIAGDRESADRIDEALAEASRLLRGTMSQLHPAVLDTAGLLPALRDTAESFRARGRFRVELDSDGWDEGLRTDADELLLTTTRELLTNVVKHARASLVRIELGRIEAGRIEAGRIEAGRIEAGRIEPGGMNDLARLVVADDGVGMGEVDLEARLGAGHLGLASRRIRIEAAGGTIAFRRAEPRGTVVEVQLPIGLR